MKELIDKKTGLKRSTVRKLTEKGKDLDTETKESVRKYRKMSESKVKHRKHTKSDLAKAHAHMKKHGG